MKFVIAKKAGMSQLFDPDGRARPVTVLEIQPNVVTQIKTEKKEGYNAVQLGAFEILPQRLSRPERGHLKGLASLKHLAEFRSDKASDLKWGDTIRVNIFSPGDKVTIKSVSIAKGFQGVVKRHGFAGGPASHGHRHVLRAPGAIGGRFPQRVLKGKRMAGRTGGREVTVKNIEVVRVDETKNLLFIAGAVPGKKGSIVKVTGK